jgi:16S rRNA (uracil1498-N3)-methyltransferase
MRLTRNFVEAPLAPGRVVTLSESTTAHLVRVLRLGLGDACVVFNGDGCDYEARLVSLGRRGAEVEVMSSRAVDTESPLRVTLVQAIARGEKMDWVLQKVTELGVDRVVPVITERTEVKLDAERGEKRAAHWRGVIAAACEQSGRARLPTLDAPSTLRDWLADSAPGWFLDPLAEASLTTLPAGDAITLVVGPEGGLGQRDLAARAAYRNRRAGRTGGIAGPARRLALTRRHFATL